MTMEEMNTGISERFTAALVAMKTDGKIKNFAEVQKIIGINKGNFSKQMKDPTRAILRPAWLTLLVENYGINAAWLLTGSGNMYVKERENL